MKKDSYRVGNSYASGRKLVYAPRGVRAPLFLNFPHDSVFAYENKIRRGGDILLSSRSSSLYRTIGAIAEDEVSLSFFNKKQDRLTDMVCLH